MRIRTATIDDFVDINHCNRTCMKTNYKPNFLMYLLCSWPQLSYVVENDRGNCVGYVISKMGEEDEAKEGTIISIAVRPFYRRFGLARQLMHLTLQAMVDCFRANCAKLDVRVSNQVAYDLYTSLGFKIEYVQPKFYEDDEDSYRMVLKLSKPDKAEENKDGNEILKMFGWASVQSHKTEVF